MIEKQIIDLEKEWGSVTNLFGLLIGSALVIIITVLYGVVYYYSSAIFLDVATEHIRGS